MARFARIERLRKLCFHPGSEYRKGRSLPRGRCCGRGSREQKPVNAKCEPKDIDVVAHQKLREFAMSFEVRAAYPGLRASETKPSHSLRIVRLEAPHIGDKLAREVKAADRNNPRKERDRKKGTVYDPTNGEGQGPPTTPIAILVRFKKVSEGDNYRGPSNVAVVEANGRNFLSNWPTQRRSISPRPHTAAREQKGKRALALRCCVSFCF